MESHASAGPIVLIHGLWLTAESWDGWKERFEGHGHRVLAPPWPRMDVPTDELRRDPSPLNGLGLEEIVEHYVGVIRKLDRPPIIIGHSFGGLVTEILLDRGLGAVGVGLSPAQVKGVLRLPLATLRATFPVFKNPAARNRTTELTRKQFHYAFTNTMSEPEAKSVYDRYEVPGTNRVLFQAAFANFNPNAPSKVDFHKRDRAPLLVVGNGADHTVTASVSKEAATRLAKSGTVVEYKEFPGRPHLTAGAPGWEEVADYVLEWSTGHAAASVQPTEPAGA